MKRNKESKGEKEPALGKCRFCGGIVAPDARFCMHCGTQSPIQSEESHSDEPDYSDHVRIAKVLWIVMLLLLISLFIGIWFFPEYY